MKKAIILIAIIALIALAGCSQPPSNPPTTPAGANNRTAPSGNTTAPPGNNAGTVASQPAFSDVASKLLTAKFKATYQMTSTAQPGQNIESTQYMLYPKQRTDMTVEGKEIRTLINLSSGEYISCFNNSGWACMKLPNPQAGRTDTAFEASKNQSDFDTSFDGTMTVAGRTGNCYKISKKTGIILKSRICATTDGILLYTMTETEQGSSTTQATSISTDVSESDFTPPATPQDLSGTIPAGLPQ
ncbi:MAG: hypothetical protein Q7R70_05140 [Candidatus Diapherotrites archaeon]|nr:hypothetical protein [Candidatus Diapherotrites archaeon]